MGIVFMIGATIIAVVLLCIVWIKNKSRYLRGKDLKKIEEAWALMLQVNDPVRKILEADKILDHALKLLGYKGTLGEKLKKAGPRFSNINDIWKAHKLRNMHAHEIHQHTSAVLVENALKAFEQGINELKYKT